MSFAENKATPIATGDLGLDRTWINAEDKVQLISEPAQDTGENASAVKDFQYANDNHHERDQDNLSKRKRLSLSAKRVFHIGNDTTNKPLPAAPILADAPQTDSDSRLVSQPPIQETHKLKDLAHEPVGTVKSKVLGQGGHQAASNLAAKEISHGREVELVRAHDEIARARTETERLLAIKNVDEMMAARQDMFVRWTMDRHVTKMRILPRNTIHPKDRKEFVRRDAKGKERMDWEAYIVHVAEYYAEQYGGEYIGFTDNPPNPTKEVLVPSIERLLVSSAPLQEFVMAVRRIYRWEDWNETLKYLWAYSTLWALNLILPGLLAGVIYLIIHRKVRPPTIEDLRKDIMRTENLNETALTLAEFIEKEGDQRWVDPLIERVGPWLLVQLSDLANLMEVLRNFYEWRVPSRTGISIGILGLALLVVTLTPLWLLVRAITLAMGIIFFGLFPISSRFPGYRLIASPVKWVFWKIPTHAEWAVKVLQAEGARHRRADIPKPKPVDTTNYTPDPLGYRGAPEIDSKSASSISPLASIPEKDYGSYKCRGGHLIITSTGVRFESSPGRTGHWSLPYPAITRLEKMTRHVQKNIGRDSGDDLRLVGPDGMERVLLNMEKRDECFSQIVGYSDVTWQVVW